MSNGRSDQDGCLFTKCLAAVGGTARNANRPTETAEGLKQGGEFKSKSLQAVSSLGSLYRASGMFFAHSSALRHCTQFVRDERRHSRTADTSGRGTLDREPTAAGNNHRQSTVLGNPQMMPRNLSVKGWTAVYSCKFQIAQFNLPFHTFCVGFGKCEVCTVVLLHM